MLPGKGEILLLYHWSLLDLKGRQAYAKLDVLIH